MSTQPPGLEPPAPAVVPEVLPAVEAAGPVGAGPAAGLGAASLAGSDPRAGLTPDRVVALSARAGNVSVARMLTEGALLQRQGKPAPAPAPAPAPGDPAAPAPANETAPPAAEVRARQVGILSGAILGVSNAFNQVYLAQQTGLANVRRDLEKKNEPGLVDTLIWALVDAALGAGIQKVTALVADKVGTIAVDRLSGPVAAAINQAGTLSTQPREPVLTATIEAAGRARATALSASVSAAASAKVTAGAAAARAKIASDVEEVEKFLNGQELALIDLLANRQSEVTSTLTGALMAAPFDEAMTAATAMKEAADDARKEADILQYLASSAAWGQALSGGGAGQDAALAKGARGVIFVTIPDEPGGDFKILSAKIDGLPDQMRARLRSTPAFQQRTIADWPIATVIQNRGLYLAVQAGAGVDDNAIRFGHDWLVQRGKLKYNMDQPGPANAKIAGALLQGELRQRKMLDLGPALGL